MNIPSFKKKTAAPLVDQLANKAVELRNKEAAEYDAANDLREAADKALAAAAKAERQASAVEDAFVILDEAGVSL